MEILDLENISFGYADIGPQIISDVSFTVNKGDFVSIVGPSGCGKSTLLRIIAGLVKSSGGNILYHEKRIAGPVSKISFVFQDFALMPWLTNLENVKIGLSRVDISDDEKARRAKNLLERVGLSGLGSSYPNALSGGMKQRVGIARAIASDPEVLLMDEPFSALDELTANTLRGDIVYMLESKDISVNAVIMVTHNVEEAVELSNKIVVLSSKPSKIKRIININSSRPRNKRAPEFTKIVDLVYATLAR
ncbi:MAG: ABC transporter ATP-binding protein [Candidatus Micrarchaeota archaeon]|nr:ABC transporter ATP-binding protein [Candidatus Micrarchaeota archaeon]